MKLTNMILTAALATAPLMASDKTVDPADLTQVNTFLWAQGGNNDYTITGGVAGNITEDISYLGLLEHSRSWKRDFGNKDDKTRVRLFGVHNVDWGFISAVGLSADYIHGHKNKHTDGGNIKSNMQAYGVIAKIETGLDWLSLYPNIAYVNSKVSLDGSPRGDFKLNSEGYQANLFASIYLDDKGKYLMVQPQYTNTKHFENQKIEVSYGQPISSDKKWWVDVKAGYEKDKAKFNNTSHNLDSQSTIKLGLSYYF